MLHPIYLGSQNLDLGVTSNPSWPCSSYKEPLVAIVVVSTVSYQPITTHYVIVSVCKSNKTTCPRIEVEQSCQFDWFKDTKTNSLAKKQCNVQLSHCWCMELPCRVLISGLLKFLWVSELEFIRGRLWWHIQPWARKFQLPRSNGTHHNAIQFNSNIKQTHKCL